MENLINFKADVGVITLYAKTFTKHSAVFLHMAQDLETFSTRCENILVSHTRDRFFSLYFQMAGFSKSSIRPC